MRQLVIPFFLAMLFPSFTLNACTEGSIDWQSYLSGARLVFVNSNYTGTYGGGGATITIDLCRNGYFHYHSESSVYVPDAGGYGTATNTHVYGTWKVLRKNGMNLLYGKSSDGQQAYYRLQMGKNGKIYVEGALYYVQRGKANC